MSYELSKLYYLTDKALITILRIILLLTPILALYEYVTGSLNVLLLLGTLILCMGCLLHMYKTVNMTYKQYRFKLGDNDYPSVHIGYTEGVLEVTRVSNYALIPFSNISKVGVLNLGFTVVVLVKSEDPTETIYFLMNRKQAIHFRERLKEELLHYKRKTPQTKSTINNYKEKNKLYG